MASRGCSSNKIAGALIAVVVLAAAVTLVRAYGFGARADQGKNAAQALLNDCAADPVAVKLIEDGEARTIYETDDAELVWSGKDKLDFLLRILKRIAARIPLETCSPGWNACAPYCNRALCT